MMIEAVPFFHILVNIIQAEIGDDVSLKQHIPKHELTSRIKRSSQLRWWRLLSAPF
jgi:hypothetical protein